MLYIAKNRRQSMMLVVIIACVAAIVMNVASLAAEEEGKIKFGVLAPLTGPYAIVGERVSQGINQAIYEINSDGGIVGRQLEAIIVDDETNPKTAIRVMRRLILEHKVTAVFGPLHGGAAIAATNEAAKFRTPVIPWAATEEINTVNCNRYTWRVGSSAQQTSRAGAVIAHRMGYTKWATISADFSYGHSVVDQFTDKLTELDPKVKIAEQAWPKLGEEDFSPYISTIARAKPDAVFVGLFGADVVKFLKQAKAFGMYEQTTIFTDFGGNQVVLAALGNDAPFGHWASARYLHNYPDTEINRDFVKTFVKRNGIYPDMVAGEAYASVQMIAEAIRRAGKADKEMLVDELGGLAYNAPEGWIIMRPSDHQGWQSSFWGKIGRSKKYDFPVLTGIQVISPIEGAYADELSGQGCRK